jgi:hypothetical protein
LGNRGKQKVQVIEYVCSLHHVHAGTPRIRGGGSQRDPGGHQIT